VADKAVKLLERKRKVFRQYKVISHRPTYPAVRAVKMQPYQAVSMKKKMCETPALSDSLFGRLRLLLLLLLVRPTTHSPVTS